jgi:drug/metabolite transporter (DMT)-like permease
MADLTPTLAVALAAALGWALFDLLRRFLVARVSAWALVVWVTVPALPLIVVWGYVAHDWRVASGYLLPAAASVALNIAANFAYFRAFQLSPLSVTLPMLSLTPVFSAVLGALFLHQPLAPRAGLGIALVVAGAFGLATGGALRPSSVRFEIGSLVMGGVALCWSTTLLLDKLALGHASPPLHALVLNGGVAIGGVVALALGGRTSELGSIRGAVWLLLFAVAAGVVALGCQLVAIQTIPIGLVETLKRGVGGTAAVVWGRTFFQEPIAPFKIVAVALSIAGVALVLL